MRAGPGSAACRPRDERGTAAAWTVPLLGAVALLAVLLASVGSALVAVRRAQSAADLAALAAASAHAAGRDPCTEAARVAALNSTVLDTCDLVGPGDVRVVVSTVVRGPWPQAVQVRGRARASPAGGAQGDRGGASGPLVVSRESEA